MSQSVALCVSQSMPVQNLKGIEQLRKVVSTMTDLIFPQIPKVQAYERIRGSILAKSDLNG